MFNLYFIKMYKQKIDLIFSNINQLYTQQTNK